MKKIVTRIINAVSMVVIVLALFILCTVVMTKPGKAPEILGHYVFRVMTGSMQPAVPEDSLILVRKTELSKIQPDDIISYYSTDPLLQGSVNTHRVVSVEQQGDSYIFITKGDANAIQDQYPAQGENVLGKVIYISHPLGMVVNFMSSPAAFVLLILLPIFIILVSSLIRVAKSAKNILEEEEAAAVQAAVEEVRRKQQEKADQEKKEEVSGEKTEQ